jgi:hypothetical protein
MMIGCLEFRIDRTLTQFAVRPGPYSSLIVINFLHYRCDADDVFVGQDVARLCWMLGDGRFETLQ